MDTIIAKKRADGASRGATGGLLPVPARAPLLACRMAILLLLLISGQSTASEVTVDEWDLTVGVIGPGSGDIVGTSFDEVMDPFTDSHQVELGVSNASASYDFAWDETGGHFSIESQIAAELVSDGTNRASSHGWIKITPSVDLAFRVDATMDFNLPQHNMMAKLETIVATYLPAHQTLHHARQSHGTLFDGIGSGTLTTCEDFIMPTGQTWRIGYDMDVDTYPYYPGAEGAIGTATGSVCYSFTVLPEPGTLFLALLGGMMLLRRRKH